MPFVSKTDLQWLEGHAVQDPATQGWTCKETGADINAISTGRSIHSNLIRGAGSGEVRRVLHLYCRGCNPKFEAPTYGTPIQEGDLVEVG